MRVAYTRMMLPLIALLFVLPATATAQELIADDVRTLRAEVVRVVSEEDVVVPGTDLPAVNQSIEARILETGDVVTIENDYLALSEGEKFYMRRTIDGSGFTYYAVLERYRLPQLAGLAMLFVAVVAAFGGSQGMRGLFSLGASIMFILYVLLPAMVAGYSPVLVSIAAAAAIVVLGSYITHGVSWMTTTAVLGMIVTIIVTGILASLSIAWTSMTGMADEASTYLLLNSRGSIDLSGLYLGGILIGLLGALYDAAIGQSVAVEELKRADPTASPAHVFSRALRVGREHIGALVNTLAIAYVGASLPLLLFFYGAPELDLLEIINRELFSSELVRIFVSSIGVVLVVPVTTLIAVSMITPNHDSKPHSHGHAH